MPYDRPYDKEGNLEKRLKYSNIYMGSAELSNPLYEAMLSNFTTDTDRVLPTVSLLSLLLLPNRDG